MNDSQIKHMVDRFLSWKLPETFAPDGGVRFVKPTPQHAAHWPRGTNLLDANQAREMIGHLVEGLPGVDGEATQDPSQDEVGARYGVPLTNGLDRVSPCAAWFTDLDDAILWATIDEGEVWDLVEGRKVWGA